MPLNLVIWTQSLNTVRPHSDWNPLHVKLALKSPTAQIRGTRLPSNADSTILLAHIRSDGYHVTRAAISITVIIRSPVRATHCNVTQVAEVGTVT